MEQDVLSSSSCAALCVIHGVGGAKRDNVCFFFFSFFYLPKIKRWEGEIVFVNESHTFLSEEGWMNGSAVQPNV